MPSAMEAAPAILTLAYDPSGEGISLVRTQFVAPISEWASKTPAVIRPALRRRSYSIRNSLPHVETGVQDPAPIHIWC